MGVERRWLGKGKRGREKSVKYPQLDATHWHTVSMQILFTLSPPLSPSTMSASPSFSFTRNLLLPPRESGATHVCISGLHRAHTSLPRTPRLIHIIPHFVSIPSPSASTPSALPKQTLYERSLMIRRDATCSPADASATQFLLTSCRSPFVPFSCIFLFLLFFFFFFFFSFVSFRKSLFIQEYFIPWSVCDRFIWPVHLSINGNTLFLWLVSMNLKILSGIVR